MVSNKGERRKGNERDGGREGERAMERKMARYSLHVASQTKDMGNG